VATLEGLLVGLGAAGTRRFAGSVLMRFTDIGLAIPGLLLAAAIATILGRGTLSLIVGLAAVFWAPIARVTYGQAVVLRERVRRNRAGQGARSPPSCAPACRTSCRSSARTQPSRSAVVLFSRPRVPRRWHPSLRHPSLASRHLIYYRSHGPHLFMLFSLMVVAANLVESRCARGPGR
jgi:hypothetical protein